MRQEKIFTNKTGPRSVRRRLLLVAMALGLGFAIVSYRAYSLQVAPRQEIGTLAERQHRKNVPEPLGRGHIYDRNGDELAISVPSYSLVAHPHLIKSPKAAAEKLTASLDLSRKEVFDKVTRKSKFAWLKRHLSPKEAQVVSDLSGQGFSMVKESRRFYPNRLLAASILGAVGFDDKGLSGLEYFYDKQLRGNAVRKVAYRDARGEIIETGETLIVPDASNENPSNLILTIDRQIQFVAEKELAETVNKYQASGGTVIVMDPHSGAILAMVSYPSFNPNEYGKYDQELWKNKASSMLIEPGSTFKIITAAAALDAGVIKPSDMIFCENGAYRIGKEVIHDHDPYGYLSVAEVIKYSSNIGTYKMTQKVGDERLYETIRKFGFGEKTNIDFPGEISGQLRAAKRWTPIDRATLSFGQGVGVSPLQMTNAIAAVASGGVRFQPYLVQKMVDEQGETLLETKPKVVARALSAKTARTLSQMMKTVVEGGTGTLAAIPGYSIAGKTGTAQKIDPKTRRYSKTNYFSSFVGFAPVSNPQLVIFVGIDEPKGLTYGGQVAAPVFSAVGLSALQHLGIPPDQPLVAQKKQNAPKALSASLGKFLLTENKAPSGGTAARRMLDLQGLSMREAATQLGSLCRHSRISGSGFVVAQEPLPGTALTESTVCRVALQPRE